MCKEYRNLLCRPDSLPISNRNCKEKLYNDLRNTPFQAVGGLLAAPKELPFMVK